MSISKSNWFKLFVFKRFWLFVGLMVICLIFAAYLGSLVPVFMADLSRSYQQLDLFYDAIVRLLVLFSSVYFTRVIYELTVNKFVQLLVQNIRLSCYGKWLMSYDIDGAGQDRKDKYPQGEVMARIIGDTEAVRELMSSGSLAIFIDFFFVISCLIGLIKISLVSGVMIGGAEIVATIVLVWGSKFMRTVFHGVRYSRGIMSRTIANLVGGLRDSYYTAHHRYASKKGLFSFNDFLYKQLKANVWDASYFSVAESLYPIFLAFVVVIFPYSKISEVAIILVIVDIIQRSIGPIKSISGKVASIQRAITGVSRIYEFTNDLDKGLSSQEMSFDPSEISFNSLTVRIPHFEYEQNKGNSFSLKEVYLDGRKGQQIGIVGFSGCGKSTLLKIIAADLISSSMSLSIEVNDGETIDFHGHLASDISKYRQHVSIISQESHIFSESLKNNVTLGNGSEEDFEQFWKWIVRQVSYLSVWGIRPDDVIDPLRLSLGQKQLLSAIRSCYLRKTVVLFDEISSAMDSELEHAIRKVIQLIQKNSLTIIVTHRIETIVSSDKIVVMDNGMIVDQGEHDDLLRGSKIYQRFLNNLSSNI